MQRESSLSPRTFLNGHGQINQSSEPGFFKVLSEPDVIGQHSREVMSAYKQQVP